MKKYLKSQAKKSVSLFLAVLMVLSCWVWMAPQEAEAAKFTPLTQYTVTVKWQLADRKGKYTGGNIKYKTLGDGWGSESSEQTAVSSLGDCLTNNKSYSKSFTTTSFPSVVKVTYEGGNTEWGSLTQDGNKARCEVLEILINDKTVWKGNTGYNGANSAEVYCTNGDGAGDAGNAGGTYSWQRPRLVGFNDDSASASDIDVTLNQIGGQDITGTTNYNIANYVCYNQYGVKISDPTNYINNGRVANLTEQTTYVSGTKNSDDGLSGEDASDIYAESNTSNKVIIKPNLQISNPKGTTGAATYYLVRKYVYDDTFGGSITSKVSAQINVTYPKYTVTFDGGLDTAKIVADKEYTKSYAPTGYHGTNITVPSKTTADGYTFYEYWSKPQPATGAASYNAAAADFAKPCTSEDYASYLADGGSEKDGIVTDKDGGKWYDAGVKLDPSSAKTIDVSDNKANFTATWYAWWLAKDLSVKFYDVDGTFLGEKLVKSGQTQGAITWPTSKYVNGGYATGAFKFAVDANVWVNTDGVEINKNSYTFTKDLILTPKATRMSGEEGFKNKYTVTFINPNNGNSVGVGTEGTYDYRADIKSYADTALGKIADVPADVDGDLQYRYELLGWTSVAPTTGKKYHILLEDGDFDVNGTSIGLNSDWVVRDDAVYYAVYRRYTKTYVVKFTYKDATGADTSRQVKFKYGEKLVAPTAYVPYNYVTKGFGYTFADWQYTDANGVKATFAYSGEVAFTSENFEIAASALDDGVAVEPIVVKALYGQGVATPYSVTFNYVKNKAEYSSQFTVKNEEFILQESVVSLVTDEKWDDGEALYTFAGQWEITEGIATVGVDGAKKEAGAVISTADLITLTPTSNLTFKAVYANPVPFFTVTYIDGDKTFTDRILKGENVPAWVEKVDNGEGELVDQTYVPANKEAAGGTLVFQGWYDEKQTDTEYKVTNGKKITLDTVVEKNLTLYPQFKFVADKFTVKFMNYDGSVQLSAGEYEKGQNIEALTVVATKAAQGRAADNNYIYEFIGWDKAVPTFCEGYDVTFTALYKTINRYYDAKWYNSRLVDGKWVADKSTTTNDEGKEVETYLLATTKHTYESRVFAPSVGDLVCNETAPDGQTYVFAGWYYTDAEGNAVKYTRGMTITAHMEFYATFTLTDKYYTVTTVVKGEEETYSVAAGEAVVISDPKAGYVNAEKHDAFDGWYTDEECTNAFNLETKINADTKIYAKFVESNHDFSNKEIKTAPTYYAVGEMTVWCACDTSKTRSETIAKLKDTVAPTGTIYLGEHSWSSNGTPAYETDNQPISIFVNKNTDIIVTANDTGDVDPIYNPAGTGIGVKYIRAFAFPANIVLTAENYGAAQSVATVIYEDTTEAATNNANFATKVGDIFVAEIDEDGAPVYENGNVKFGPLKEGEDYIIYYYVNDKATTDNGAPANGNLLNRFVRTAKFTYDNTAPTFTVEGEGNGKATPTYCGTATVTGLEKDVTLKINDAVVTVDYEEGAETGTYTITYAESLKNVMIVAVDKAGNKTEKKIKLAEHDYYTVKVESTCTDAGSTKDVCLVCGDVQNEEPLPTVGHIMGMPEITPADCVNNGYVTRQCQNCDYTETAYEVDGELLFPAEGHDFDMEDGEIVYTTITASTCKTKGSAEAICKVCAGELEGGKLTKVLELDGTNHEKVSETELLPTCTEAGYYTKSCICGVVIESKTAVTDPETYAAKGHGEEVERIISEPTCYQDGEKEYGCPNCVHVFRTEVIPATGEHVKIVANPDTYMEDLRVEYKCATDGCPYEYEAKILEAEEELEEYTVTFKAEDGSVIETVKVIEGEKLNTAPTAPEKTSTKTYTYTFAGWKDESEKTVKLPYAVTGNVTLKASYKEAKIMYTHLFTVPTTWTSTLSDTAETKEFTRLVGGYLDVRVPSATPVFTHKDKAEDARLKSLYTFEFKYWKDADGNKVTDFTVYDDAEFFAHFVATPIVHEVIFYNGSEVIWTTTVDAGASVTYANFVPGENGEDVLVIPEKAYDNNYHYEYNAKWYTDAACKTEYVGAAITEKTRLYAGFTATAHNYVVDTTKGEVVPESDPEIKDGILQAADCVNDEITAKVCDVCGHEIEVVTTEAYGHDYFKKDADGNYVLDDNNQKVENGEIKEIDGVAYYVVSCSRCGEVKSKDKVSVTVKFKNFNGVSVSTKDYQIGETIVIPAAPTKAEDDANTYTFSHWYVEGDPTKAEATITTATADITYVAEFTATLKKFKVSYVRYNSNIAIQQIVDVAYGSTLPAYTGSTSAEVIFGKDYKDLYVEAGHYVFNGEWDKDASYIVKSDTTVSPVVSIEAHDKQIAESDATCTEPGGTKTTCKNCNYCKNENATSPALGHAWNDGVVTKEPVYETQTPGVLTKSCTREGCNETKDFEIPGDSYSIKTTVKDENGNPSANVRVELQGKQADGTYVYLTHKETNADGVAIFTNLVPGDYRVYVASTKTYSDATVKEDGKVSGGNITAQPKDEPVDDSCKCSCHKDNFWGTIYRLVQKIIKFFAGKASCCADPDSRI